MGSCMSKESECSAMFQKDIVKGGSKADFEQGFKYHCKSEKLGCEKKMEQVGTCAPNDWKTWESAGCDQAASAGTIKDKATDCCAAAKALVKCMDPECNKLQMKSMQLKAKDAGAEEKARVKKEMDKSFAIGKACPESGVPKSAADLQEPAADTDSSSAWVSLPHAIPFVVMLGSLLA